MPATITKMRKAVDAARKREGKPPMAKKCCKSAIYGIHHKTCPKRGLKP